MSPAARRSQSRSRGRSKKDADEWRRRHLISFAFLQDEFLPNPEFVFPSD